ncbi:MAG: tryptophan--tRNA ligase [Pseudomonadota bacterium]|nr:tryptophan--tRNA ligase [Pseudomonadota bacterium]
MSQFDSDRRVLSGMRPTGNLHLGHYHGVLKNWVKLQHEYECFFFVADWHALTTHYDRTESLAQHTRDLVIDWLAAGVEPGSAKVFVQSHVPEHAELHLLLSMITPLSWLERVPTYKDQQENLKEKDLSTYGFLGYPLLQSADILLYRAGLVPVGADQVAHVEITREVARRFNFVFGRELGFEELVEQALKRMGKKAAKVFAKNKKMYQETGTIEALEIAQALVREQANLNGDDRERLLGDLEGTGKMILPEPKALLTEAAKMPGLDGRKMSKSYGNTISLRDAPDEVEQKIRRMPTDPARIRLTDAGNPENCPVWEYHKIYTDEDTHAWVQEGCRSASIGCVDCKMRVSEQVIKELKPIQERAQYYMERPDVVNNLLDEGSEAAREEAQETLELVRDAIGLIG